MVVLESCRATTSDEDGNGAELDPAKLLHLAITKRRHLAYARTWARCVHAVDDDEVNGISDQTENVNGTSDHQKTHQH